MRPFQFSRSASTGGTGGSLQLSVKRWRVNVGAAAALGLGSAGMVGGCLLVQHRHKQRPEDERRIVLSQTAAEAISGAIGELTQIAILYPLDTVKVRCQAAGCSAAEVVHALIAKGTTLNLVRQLYAGVLGAALCSLAVGSLHWATYCASKRTAGDLCARLAAQHSAAEPDAPARPLPVRGIANAVASLSSALMTALVEAPVELFRHNAQAGLIRPNFLMEMVRATRHGGPGELYRGFLPYCFESWPYDITELLTYGHLKDVQTDLQGRSSPASWLVSIMPAGAWDLGIGAVAGTAAVLLSMPFDCVKTYMQTHSSEMVSKGVVGGTAEFFLTGRRMVARSGVGALYVGVVPRLLQQVPACMVCWWAIEASSRALDPFVDKRRPLPPSAPATFA